MNNKQAFEEDLQQLCHIFMMMNESMLLYEKERKRKMGGVRRLIIYS